MSNQNNNDKSEDKFAKAVEFCKKNVRYIAVAGLFVVLVAFLAKGLGKQNSEDVPLQPSSTAEAPTEVVSMEEPSETVESYEQDAYPEVNEVINNYYGAYANGDIDALALVADPLSEAEKSSISVVSQYIEECQNISCYTKKGLEDGAYIVSAYMEMKFKDIETSAPGLETFYVRTKEDGSLYIDNKYGQFNSKRKEFDLDETISEYLDSYSQQEDFLTLLADVQKKYDEALSSDEALKTLVEQTIPDVATIKASEQIAAAKKAEEERIAAEEAAKKAAEEEAAKAQELANAVAVYAIDKVNVRKEPSEEAEIIGQLELGAQTTRLEDKDGWSRVDYSEGTQGYVKSEFLSTEQPAAPEAPAASENTDSTDNSSAAYANGFAEGTVITLKETVNVRKSMSEDAERVVVAIAGDQVTVILSYAEGWTKVTYGDKTGFIKTELLQ